MLIHLVKFFHILIVLSLLGGTLLCAFPNKFKTTFPLKKGLITLSFFAILTGTVLVYPKHFTFYTPWIKAAYLLSLFFMIGMIFFLWMEKRSISRLLMFAIVSISIIILLLIIHDAVTKSTFLF